MSVGIGDKVILVVCGLKAEAGIAAGDGVMTICGGGDQRRLAADLARLAPTVSGIISFGVAGGLDPRLKPGDIRIGDGIVTADGRRFPVDAGWVSRLHAKLGVPTALFAAVEAPLADVAGKAALRAATGAATVDMESHLAARAAQDAGVPFAALRVVTDPAGRSLPHAAAVGMRADGSVDLAAIIGSLMKKPGQVPGLIRTGLEARKAFAALLRGRQLLGSDFAFLDLV